MSWNARVIGGLALAATLGPASAQFTATGPVGALQVAPAELAVYEQGQVNGLPALQPGNHPFRMASAVKVQAYGKGSAQQVSRQSGVNAWVYKAVPAKPAPMLPTWPTSAYLHQFQQVGDNAQAWATMSPEGVPYLYLTAYGQSQSESTASWSTAVTIPSGSVSPKVVLRFVVPPSTVDGATEEQGPARWRAHLRAELLVNGYPAWSTEAMRFALDPYGNALQQRRLQTFGAPWPFPTNDDDADSTNDSPPYASGPSARREVFLSLGRFPPGAVLDLSMIVRGVARTVGKNDTDDWNRCQPRSEDPSKMACSNAGVTVRGDPADGPRIYLVP